MKRKTLKVVYSQAAVESISDIVSYCRREFGVSVGRRVRAEFDAVRLLLAQFHYLCPTIERGSVYRKFVTAGKNTIVYRFDPIGTEDRILIVAVFSAGRNINYSDIAD